MADQDGNTSIAARIAALKLDQVGRQTGGAPIVNKRPGIPSRHQSTNVPPIGVHTSAAAVGHDLGNQPRTNGLDGAVERKPAPTIPNRPARSAAPVLPPRKPASTAPQLPPRRPSESPSEPFSRPESGRKLSSESAVSTRSSISSASTRTGINTKTSSPGPPRTVKAPLFDASALPPLPPKRAPIIPERSSIPLQQSKSSPNVLPSPRGPELPARPPLPSRTPSSTPSVDIKPQPPRRSALSMGFGSDTTKSAASLVKQPASDAPPPIPTSSRPDLSKLLASKPSSVGAGANKTTAAAAATPALASQDSCLKCRDFSVVDAHAARFPRQSIPSQDLGWLAQSLTCPFPSLTDKARAIFVWLHHNIDYNTHVLFTNTVKGSTPASTLSTGLAVCEGYAGLFTALATKAGLESMVIGGHGKGLGYEALGPGDPLPPENASGHAWNVVKIDNGQWKLIDACWGAGHVNGWGQPYQREFHAVHFTATNEEFGRSHFPSDKNRFYRSDGRHSITWAEYLLGDTNGWEPLQTFGNMTTDEGIDEHSIMPRNKQISANDPEAYMRFQMNKVCVHWDNERNGKGKNYLYLVFLPAGKGRPAREVPLQTNGQFWWVDVRPDELGEAGQEIKLGTVTTWNGRDGRGMMASEYDKQGGFSCSYAFAARWELV